MSWFIAPSLVVLRDEVNALWPAREKQSDGFIGDAAHAASASDHNPNTEGAVCAFDITHDPNGPDGSDLAERLRTRPHPTAKYLIWNRQIASVYPRNGFGAWEWRPYSGTDPHTNHVHVSVGVGPDGQSQPGTYNDTSPWLTQPEADMTDQEHVLLVNASDKADKAWHAVAWLAGEDPDTFQPSGSGMPLANKQLIAICKHLGIDPNNPQ